jgi:hypothetical protein
MSGAYHSQWTAPITHFLVGRAYNFEVTRWQRPSIEPLLSVSRSRPEGSTGLKAMAERRRARRQDAGWVGKWRLADDPDPASFECKVLDISMLGVGLETAHGAQVDLIGRKVAVTAQPLAGGSVSIRLVGVIRHVNRSVVKTEFRGGAHGRLFRLGIEFAGLSQEERAMLDVLGHFLGETPN